MPLESGDSPKAVSDNIRKLLHESYPKSGETKKSRGKISKKKKKKTTE